MDDISIYQTDSGALEVRLQNDTVWLTQRQLGELFGTTPENILMHLKNIYREE